MIDRVPPCDIDAEKAVLGACMIGDRAIDDVSVILDGTEFYYKPHSLIYTSIIHLHQSGKAVDMITLSDELKLKGALDNAGGIVYIADLAGQVATMVNAKDHAQIIKSKWQARGLLDLIRKTERRVYDDSFQELMEEMNGHLELLTGTNQDGGLSAYMDIALRTMEHIEKIYVNKGRISGIRTGFDDLDLMTSGWKEGQVIILAGAAKIGKTSLMMRFADRAAIDGHKVAIFSLEMDEKELMTRHLSMASRIPTQDIDNGRLTDSDWGYLVRAASDLSKFPIWVDDRPNLTIQEISAQCKNRKRDKGLDIVIIDYLQLVKPQSGSFNREQEVAQISRQLKLLAKSLHVPVIALSQLSRKVEERQGARPRPSDLRESGAQEQNADKVLFVYRPSYYDILELSYNHKGQTITLPSQGMAEIIVALQRNGPTGSVLARWDESLTSFTPYQLDDIHIEHSTHDNY